jgi:hypothetical protein
MPLKLTVTDLTEVPEALRGAYKQRTDGSGYIVDIEGGVVAKATHEEFRTNNIALKKKLEAFGDLTPEQVTELRETNDTLKSDLDKARKGKDSDAEARIKALTDGHTKALDAITKERDGLKTRIDTLVIDQEVARVAAEVGAHVTAIEDITGRIRSRFKVGDDGKAYAVDPQGEKVYGEDGKPLGIDGAVRQLTKQAPHLFQSSSGGGAANQSAGGGRSKTAGNPWKKESWNVTEQMKLVKADKAEANRLATEAGTTLGI